MIQPAARAEHRRRPSGALAWCAQALLVAAIAWGAFAFGGVYPWAYWPLAAAAAAVAVLSLLAAPVQRSLHHGPLAVALTLFAVAVAFQLASLPAGWLRMLSPRASDVVNVFDLAAGAHPDRHPLSIAPRLTATALVLFASFSLLAAGTARLASIRGPRSLARAVAVIGALVAMAGIVQQPLYNGKIYGFWTSRDGGYPFGPFVNRNHFAGWMMMALPLALGLLSAGIARGMRHVKPTMHDRIAWLSSADASRLALLAAAAAVMALSLVLTFSRSGIVAMLFALALTFAVTVRRQESTARCALAATSVVLLVVGVTAWAGVDTVASRFADTDWHDFNGRRAPWADAAAVTSRFPVTGTGLNTYGVAMLFYQQHDLARYYSQAHNDYLQLAAEGGVLLIVPAVLCVAALGIAVWKRFKEEMSTSGYWLRVGAVTGLCAIALQETVDFSLQMPGNGALFAVLCGIALHRTPESASR